MVTSITGGTICGLPILYGRLILWLTVSRLWEAIEDISPPTAHRASSSTACSQPMQLDWLPVSPRDLPLYYHSARVPATLLHAASLCGFHRIDLSFSRMCRKHLANGAISLVQSLTFEKEFFRVYHSRSVSFFHTTLNVSPHSSWLLQLQRE